MTPVAEYQTRLKTLGLYVGKIDGDFGPLTLTAAQSYHTAAGKVPPWMPIAAQELGVSEILGPRNNPRIGMYHASTTLGEEPDEVAWCSSFVNWTVEQSGYEGTNSAAARSWDTWGRETVIRYGAVITVPRKGGSGRHVTLCAGWTETHFFGLGGNQSDKVCIVPFHLNTRSACRWPSNRA
jgi:uncharacterized protein (TIGR02594 family)